MRKAVSVLALIAFACDFLSRDVLVHGDPAGKPEAAGRGDGYEHHQVRSATSAGFALRRSPAKLRGRHGILGFLESTINVSRARARTSLEVAVYVGGCVAEKLAEVEVLKEKYDKKRIRKTNKTRGGKLRKKREREKARRGKEREKEGKAKKTQSETSQLKPVT